MVSGAGGKRDGSGDRVSVWGRFYERLGWGMEMDV